MTGLFTPTQYNKSIVLWRSELQKTISLLTAEAKYYAAPEIAIKITYLRDLFKLHNMDFQQGDATPVYEDNTACIKRGTADASVPSTWTSASTFAHQVFQNRQMRLIRVSTRDPLADIITKALPLPHFEPCVEGLMRGPDPKGS